MVRWGMRRWLNEQAHRAAAQRALDGLPPRDGVRVGGIERGGGALRLTFFGPARRVTTGCAEDKDGAILNLRPGVLRAVFLFLSVLAGLAAAASSAGERSWALLLAALALFPIAALSSALSSESRDAALPATLRSDAWPEPYRLHIFLMGFQDRPAGSFSRPKDIRWTRPWTD